MTLVGYARVSSAGQTKEVQLEKLKHCDRIFLEEEGGMSNKWLSLQDCLEYLRNGDILVVTRLDRLARSTFHLCKITEILKQKQVNLEVLDQDINTGDATGQLFLKMLEAFNEFETEIRSEIQMEGIVKAKKKGIPFGRKKKITPPEVKELQRRRKSGTLIKTLMEDYNLSKASVYRYLKQ